MPTLFVSHCSGEPDLADRVIRRLQEGLKAKVEVWVDQTELRPGDRWDDEIWSRLYTCDAAVIVCSAEALESDWVLIETVILVKRRKTTNELGVFPLAIEPVTISDVTNSRLSTHGIATPTMVAVTAAGFENTIGLLVDQLAALAALDPSGRPLCEWEERIGAIIHEKAPDGKWVITIHRMLEETDGLWSDWVGLRSRLLARALLNCPEQEKRKAVMRALARYVDPSDRRAIMELVIPAQISAEETRPLAEVLQRPRGDRAIVLETNTPLVGQWWVTRASVRSPWQAIECKIQVSADPEREISMDTTAALSVRFNTPDTERINGIVSISEVNNEPVFLLLPVTGHEKDLPAILGRPYREYPGCALLLLARGSAPEVGPFIPFDENREENMLYEYNRGST